MKNKDNYFMSMAIKLARKGNPSPNPYVGAVLVKNGEIIGKGYHRRAGLPHAEIEAINSVKDKSQITGSVLYVTLEPCSHYGKTPPCTTTIIKNEIGEVVFAVKDPTKTTNGEELLKKHKIRVRKGILEKEAELINEIFFHYSKTGLPFVAIKTAVSSDKKIGLINKRVKLTGEKANKYTHNLRSKYDSILVGINTIIIDNPKLTSRTKRGRDPLRIILDSELSIPLNSNALNDGNILIITTSLAPKNKLSLLKKNKFEILVLGKNKINLKILLKKLGKKGITSIMVEGGARIQESFLKQNLVNKLYVFTSPKKIGKKGIPLFNGFKPKNLSLYLKRSFGKDILRIYYPGIT